MDIKVNFDKEIDRKNTDSLKWNKYQDQNILPLWVADMDFKSPQPILDAITKRLEHGVLGYAKSSQKHTDTIKTMLKEKYNWSIQTEWIVWLPGVVCALNLSCQATGTREDEVLASSPIYPPFIAAPKLAERKMVTVPMLQKEQYWTMNFDGLEEAVTDKTKLYLFCNPHNPVGRIFNKQELKEFAQFCLKHNLTICSDEIHCELLLDKEKQHIPLAVAAPEIAEQCITLMAPSKTYNIPGLGCSFAIIQNPQLRAKFENARTGIVPELNILALDACIPAYTECDEWRKELLDYLRGNRDFLENFVKEELPGIEINHVEATFLAWLDVSQLNLKNPAKHFESFGVGLSDGKPFGNPNYIRLNFGCPRSTLEKALNCIKSGL